MKIKLVLPFLLLTVGFVVAAQKTIPPAIPADLAMEKKIESLLAKMTIEEKVGQLCCPLGWEMYTKTGKNEVTVSELYKKKMAEELGVGEITLTDIIKELEKPARDPRDEMPKPILRTDVLDMKDLNPGMILKGTVRNVIDFGAFVDIGVHQDGLVHISQITDKKFIKHPLEVVSVGDVVEVKVMSVDISRNRIQLTMKL